MSPQSCDLLLTKIMPALEKTVPRHVYPSAGEDAAELVQDGLAIAAGMLEADEKAGRTSLPTSIAFYTVQRLKSGSRSHSSSTTDVLSLFAQRSGKVSVVSMHGAINQQSDDGDENLCIGDLLTFRGDDPGTKACRSLDWHEFFDSLGARERDVVRDISQGIAFKHTAGKLNISQPRLTQIKQRIGRQIKAYMGGSIQTEILEKPLWEKSVRSTRENDAARHESAATTHVLRFPFQPHIATDLDPEPEAA